MPYVISFSLSQFGIACALLCVSRCLLLRALSCVSMRVLIGSTLLLALYIDCASRCGLMWFLHWLCIDFVLSCLVSSVMLCNRWCHDVCWLCLDCVFGLCLDCILTVSFFVSCFVTYDGLIVAWLCLVVFYCGLLSVVRCDLWCLDRVLVMFQLCLDCVFGWCTDCVLIVYWSTSWFCVLIVPYFGIVLCNLWCLVCVLIMSC